MNIRTQVLATLATIALLLGALLAIIGGIWASAFSHPVANAADSNARQQSAVSKDSPEQLASAPFNWRESERLLAQFVDEKTDSPRSTPNAPTKPKVSLKLHAIAKKNQIPQALVTIENETLWLSAGAPIAHDYSLLEIFPDYIVTNIPGAETLGLFGVQPPTEPTP